jgi:divalent metal cation (Fe/Co/Zn/Cd) transporter
MERRSVIQAAPVERNRVIRTALRLEIVTILWMIIEAGASIVAGIAARSLLLVAFGIDSGIELISGIVLLWRLKRESSGGLARIEITEGIERKASQIGGWLLYLLSAYVVIQAAYGLISRHAAEKSWLGIAVAIIAAGGMPFLAKGKLRIADQIESRALRADAMETLTCGYLAWVLLAGMLTNAFVHWWWIDSVASLAIVPLLLREANEALSESCRTGVRNPQTDGHGDLERSTAQD